MVVKLSGGIKIPASAGGFKVKNATVSDPFFSNVIALFHCDVDPFVDVKGHTVTESGTVTLDTITPKFGAGAAAFTNASFDRLRIVEAFAGEFDFNDFTIEVWFKTPDLANNFRQLVLSPENSFGELQFSVVSGGAIRSLINGITLTTAEGDFDDDIYHLATLVRSGSDVGIWVDGISKATGTASGAISITNLDIGGSAGFSSSTFVGSLDEIRVTNVARYTPGVNFTPPTEAFPDA